MLTDIHVIEKVSNPNKDLVPKGAYCYRHTGQSRLVNFYFDADGKKQPLDNPIKMPKIQQCPFYRIHPDKDEDNNGYCSLMGRGDWDDDSFGLLWNSVKECGINEDEDGNY